MGHLPFCFFTWTLALKKTSKGRCSKNTPTHSGKALGRGAQRLLILATLLLKGFSRYLSELIYFLI